MEKFKISHLKLAYPPLSSQEAVWAEDDPEVEKFLRQSDFYRIGGRREVILSDFTKIGNDYSFKVACGDELVDSATVHFDRFGFDPGTVLTIRVNEKLILLADGPGDDARVIGQLTTEQLLYHRAQCDAFISGLGRYREFLKYDLLYVGIAKEGDSYSRLIANGHQPRTKILSNELQRGPGARVADEIYLFLFRVEPFFVNTYDLDDEFEFMTEPTKSEQKRIVADAEKAFVSLLNPEYNKVLFKNYPRGKDGLYTAGLTRYLYSIGEVLSFSTPKGEIKGDWDFKRNFMANARMLSSWKAMR
jgi:hypothetical protein